MSKWASAGAGAVTLAVVIQILLTFDVLPVLIVLNPAAVEMWKVLLDFAARIGWPLVAGGTVLLFSPQIRKLIPRLLKLETPIGSAELNPDAPFEAGKVEAIRTFVEERPEPKGEGHLRVELEQRREEIYDPIHDRIGGFTEAVLIWLNILGRNATKEKLAAGLGVSRASVIRALVRLGGLNLTSKVPGGPVAQISEFGKAYLNWLEEKRPEAFRRARSLWKLPESADEPTK